MKNFSLILIFILSGTVLTDLYAQRPILKGPELLARSIQYHDPENQWERFKGTVYLQGKLPMGKSTYSVLAFNNEYEFYKSTRRIEGKMVTGGVSKGGCFANIDGNQNLDLPAVEYFHLTCEEILNLRNYHVHMVGLPMKLKEAGITVGEEVHLVTFQGVPSLEMRVQYETDQHAGTWLYYFHPRTYALKGYRFASVKRDQKSSGEYVVLEKELEIDGVRIPKVRRWFTDSHIALGTDELMDGKYLREADRLVLNRGD
ncbi:MAG: DUF6503 family protein [Bacteroidota bacterium]